MQKLNLTKDNKTLKIYCFSIQSGPIRVSVPGETIKLFLAYDDAEALGHIVTENIGKNIKAEKRGSIEFSQLLEFINIDCPVADIAPSAPTKIKVEDVINDHTIIGTIVREDKTAKEFVYGLMLVADKYVADKKDREELKKIISKINYDL